MRVYTHDILLFFKKQNRYLLHGKASWVTPEPDHIRLSFLYWLKSLKSVYIRSSLKIILNPQVFNRLNLKATTTTSFWGNISSWRSFGVKKLNKTKQEIQLTSIQRLAVLCIQKTLQLQTVPGHPVA